jgi:pimeloyl-ACP methyl ester carboxylesterase
MTDSFRKASISPFDLREMAADAEDLRIALRIDSWSVMALGTASRILLEYMREYPDHVRAAVLDSPEWPGVDPFIESVVSTRHAIAALVASCEASRRCRRFTPGLRAEIHEVEQRLGARPFEADARDVRELRGTGQTGQVLFDAGWFLVWLRARLAGIGPAGTYVPHAITSSLEGDESPARATRLLLDSSATDSYRARVKHNW